MQSQELAANQFDDAEDDVEPTMVPKAGAPTAGAPLQMHMFARIDEPQPKIETAKSVKEAEPEALDSHPYESFSEESSELEEEEDEDELQEEELAAGVEDADWELARGGEYLVSDCLAG